MCSRFADLLKKRPPPARHVPLTSSSTSASCEADATRRGVATVEFDADSSWRFEGFIRSRLRSYACFVTTHAASVARYRAEGVRVHLSQWAVSPWYRGYAPEAPRTIGVSFVGRPHGDRPVVIHVCGDGDPDRVLRFRWGADCLQRWLDAAGTIGTARSWAKWVSARACLLNPPTRRHGTPAQTGRH
jgi:hypothetical protein